MENGELNWNEVEIDVVKVENENKEIRDNRLIHLKIEKYVAKYIKSTLNV